MTNLSGIPEVRVTLRITRTDNGVKFQLDASESPQILGAGISPVGAEEIDALGARLRAAIGDVTLWGQPRNGFESIEKISRDCHDSILPYEIRHGLRHHGGESLVLVLEPALAPFPWELLHDGEEYLGCRFAVGR